MHLAQIQHFENGFSEEEYHRLRHRSSRYQDGHQDKPCQMKTPDEERQSRCCKRCGVFPFGTPSDALIDKLSPGHCRRLDDGVGMRTEDYGFGGTFMNPLQQKDIVAGSNVLVSGISPDFQEHIATKGHVSAITQDGLSQPNGRRANAHKAGKLSSLQLRSESFRGTNAHST